MADHGYRKGIGGIHPAGLIGITREWEGIEIELLVYVL